MKMMILTVLVVLLAGATLAFHHAEDHHGSRLHSHEEQCDKDCHICETQAAPKLRSIHKMCPKCDCARQLVNATVPPCPDVSGADRFCLQGRQRDSRGCPTKHCAATEVPLEEIISHFRKCARTCAGGYDLDTKSGLPLCSCVCPLEDVAPNHRWGYCSDQCEGRRFKMMYNEGSGCQECFCEKPKPVCPPFQCFRFCPHGFVTDEDGCPLCECQDRDSIRLNGKRCPVVGCNVNCGPHKMVAVQQNGCVTGCSCRCNVPTDCPYDQHHSGVCVERMRDEFGCPTCECTRRVERREPNNQRNDVGLCPESRIGLDGIIRRDSAKEACPNQCENSLRLYDGERNCELCDCCPNLQEDCPDLYCEQHQVNQWGCPVCACATRPRLE